MVYNPLKKEEVQTFNYPVSYFQDNLLITPDKNVWAYYFIPATQVQLHDEKSKQEELRNKQQLFHELGKQYKELDLKVLPYEFNLKEQFRAMSSDFNKKDTDISEYYADQMVKELERLYGKLTQPKFILGVKIRHYNTVLTRVDALRKGFEDVEHQIMETLGNVKIDGKELLAQLTQTEADLYQDLGAVNAERLTSEELAYLQRTNYLRNSPHPRLKEQRKQSLNEITEAILFPNVDRGVLAIQTEYGTQYMSVLPISELPDFLRGYDLFYLAQRLAFSCEFHVKAMSQEDNNPFFGTKAKAKGKGKELKNSVRDMKNSGLPISQKVQRAKMKADQALQDIESEETFFDFLACFVVYGHTAKQCRSRARQLRNLLRKLKIRCEMPLTDQEKLFHTLLPGAKKTTIKYWKQHCTSYGLAEFLFAVSNDLGNNVGWLLGVQTDGNKPLTREKAVKRSRKIVLWNPLASNQNIQGASASPHIDATGMTGNGKSYLLKLLFYILQLMNVKTLYFDPKVELEKATKLLLADAEFRRSYPAFARILQRVHYVTLDAKRKDNHGVLDPIVFLPPVEAKKVAEDILSQIYDWKRNDAIRNRMMSCLSRVIEDRANGKAVGLRTWVNMLLNHRNAEIREVGEIFENEIENSVLELIFSDGKNQGLSLNHESTVLSVEGLTLPKQEQTVAEYTQSEFNSIAVMCCVGEYIRLFGKKDSTEYTYEIFDESWVLSTSSIGRRIIQEIKKVGRAQCNGCIFASQSVKDTDTEEIKGQIGTIFAFDEPSEREEILQKLNMPVTKGNLELLQNLKQGQCLMKDSYGRVNKLSVHCLFEEWTLANKTVDRTASGNLEERYA